MYKDNADKNNNFKVLSEVDAKTLNLGTAQGHYPHVTYIDYDKFYWTVIMKEPPETDRELFFAFFGNPKRYKKNHKAVPFPQSRPDNKELKDLVNAAVGYSYSDKYSPDDVTKRIGLTIVAAAKSKAEDLVKSIPYEFISWTTDGGYFDGYIPRENVKDPDGYSLHDEHYTDAYFLSNSGDSVMLDDKGEIACKGTLRKMYDMLKGAQDVALWWGLDTDDNADAKPHFILKRRKDDNADWWDSVTDKIHIAATDLDLPIDTPKDIARLFCAFDALLKWQGKAMAKTTIINRIKKEYDHQTEGVSKGREFVDDRLNGRIPHIFAGVDNSTQIEGQFLSDKENSQILSTIHENHNVSVVAPCAIGKSHGLSYIAQSLKGTDKLIVFVPTQNLAIQTVNSFRNNTEGYISAEYIKRETVYFKDACTQSRVLVFTYGSNVALKVISNSDYCGADSIIAFDEYHTKIWFKGYFDVFNAVAASGFKTVRLTATPLFGVEASAIKELRFSKNSLFKPTIETVYLIKQQPTPDYKSLVQHIIKWYHKEKRGRRLIIYENNKQIISDCITLLQKELPEAKEFGFFTNDLDKDYNDGINQTGAECSKNRLKTLVEFEEGGSDIDILFTTQKGAEGHNFRANDKDDCFIFFNDWNTSVQFAGRFRDGLRTLTLIGDFGGDDIKTPTCTARYVADGLTFKERKGKEKAASNLLIRKRGMVVLPYVLRQMYNIGKVVVGDAQFDVAPKSNSLTFHQIVTGEMQDVMFDDLNKYRQNDLNKAFNYLNATFVDHCIAYQTNSGVLHNLTLLLSKVRAVIEGGADSAVVLSELPKSLITDGILDYFAVPYSRAFITIAGDIIRKSTKRNRKGKAKGKAWNKPYPQEYLTFIADGGEGDKAAKKYRGKNFNKGEIAEMYANGGAEKLRKNLASDSLYRTEKPKKFVNQNEGQTMNTPIPPPPPPLPTIKVITEPQQDTVSTRMANGYYGKLDAEQYAKGIITDADVTNTQTGELCPY